MNIKELSKVISSEKGKIYDSRRKKSVARSLKSKIMDTETTEEAIDVAVEALKEEEPEDVLRVVIETLGEAHDELEEKLKDSKNKKTKRTFAGKRALRKAIMDTETTEEAIDVAVEALNEAEPEEVIAATVEILSDVIENIKAE